MSKSLGVTTLLEADDPVDIFNGIGETEQISGIVIANLAINDLPRGACLGKITKGSASVAAKTGGSTGNGVLTMDAITPVVQGAKVGVYTVRCNKAAAGGGTFEIKDPDGFMLTTVLVGASFNNDLKFSISAGTTDFIVGDGFDITLAAGSGQYALWNTANTDGSQVLAGILTDATDATVTAEKACMYVKGSFNKARLTAGHTIETGVYGMIIIKEGV